jgi:hypothetical protein
VTSSTNSRRTPDPVEHHDSVRDALVEVAENSFFAFADPLDAEQFGELASAVPTWLRAQVTFDGAFGGRMTFTVPEQLGQELFASFLGESPDELADDGRLFDLVGEFGNMVCGSWLTRTCQRRRFDLQHPEVQRMEGLGEFEPSANLLVAVNGQPVALNLVFSGH